MTTIPAQVKPGRKRRRLRLSIRALIVLVLITGGGLGWVVHRARVQRLAVAAIEGHGGKVYYDWQYRHGRRYDLLTPCRWPKWLVDAVGIDYLSIATCVQSGSPPDQPQLSQIEMIQIGRLDYLENLGLSSEILTDADLTPLEGLTRLKTLSLNNLPKVTGAMLATVSRIPSLERLLIWPAEPIQDAELAHLGKLTRLTQLQIITEDFSTITEAGLQPLERMRDLKDLYLSHLRITSQGVKSIGKFGKLQRLTFDLAPGSTDLELLRSLDQLKMLRLTASPEFQNGNMKTFAGLSRLTFLDLSSTSVGDAGMAQLQGLTSLTELVIDKSKVTDAGLKCLAGMTKLEGLYARSTAISDAGVPYLLACPSLRNLLLDGTKITDAGVRELARSTQATYMSLPNTGVTAEGASAAEQIRPGLKVGR